MLCCPRETSPRSFHSVILPPQVAHVRGGLLRCATTPVRRTGVIHGVTPPGSVLPDIINAPPMKLHPTKDVMKSGAANVFQSTRPRGSRLIAFINSSLRLVSIHAPTWGATYRAVDLSHLPSRFNPRAHVGRDLSLTKFTKMAQSFNPRAHVGRDQNSTRNAGAFRVSIHAPTWGATQRRTPEGAP